MSLKNILIVVDDLAVSAEFYTGLFDLCIMREFDGKTMLTGGLVLQDKVIWEDYIQHKAVPYNCASLLYFEVEDIYAFDEKLKVDYPNVKYLNKLFQIPNGRKILRFYDPDGNLIEVGENKHD